MERPRLRPIDAFPTHVDGKPVLCLRDPQGLTDRVLFLPLATAEILQHLDGAHSILDIQAAWVRRRGDLLFREQVEQLLALLDDHLLLENARFTAAREAAERGFAAAPLRPAFHAGRAYDADPALLRATLDGFFTAPEGPGQPGPPRGTGLQAVLAPHIDFTRGGPTYAWAYRAVLEAADADCFIVLGTAHSALGGRFSPSLKDFATPFGPLATDRGFVERLLHRTGREGIVVDDFVHRAEHSIDFQAVFLQYLYAGRRTIRLVPILCGTLTDFVLTGKAPADDPVVRRFVTALQETIAAAGERVCLLGGVDLAHLGPRFGDPAPLTATHLRRVAQDDTAMLQAVTAGDAEGFFGFVQRERDRRRICGLSPIYILLKVLEGVKGTLLRYSQWPDPQGTVTFASLTFP
ncbi:MAG: AmmeMemoRadiSam system protein B [candidate division NC10 bacterium]|nr:AmmeMemoRadiSam system protein B [candidate division NC10 bacterium]